MSSSLKYVSLSYRKAPVQVREEIALDTESCVNLVSSISEVTSASDVLVVSTCNRTEVYYSSEPDRSEEIIKLICIQKGLSNPSDYIKYFEKSLDHVSSIRHLYDVSMGLESKVVGDIQISNQVKTAYQRSADLNTAGPILHRLMHSIFFANKRVSQETAFRDGAASVSYATAELTEELSSNITDPKVLILGLGEMGADVCRNLVGSNIKEVFITNRTLETAQELANETGFTAVPFEKLWEYIDYCDVIISGVSMKQALVTKEKVAELETIRGKFFIDMSVPRSVESEVDRLPGVLVYNIDNIQAQTSEILQRRIDAIPDVQAIIEESIAEFLEWSKEMELSPTIKKLKNALEQIRKEEIGKHIGKLDAQESKAVEAITKSMMQKIIKLPVLQLKAACKRGEAETLIDVLNDLFNLEEDKVNQ